MQKANSRYGMQLSEMCHIAWMVYIPVHVNRDTHGPQTPSCSVLDKKASFQTDSDSRPDLYIPHRGQRQGHDRKGHLQRPCVYPSPVIHNPVISERSDHALRRASAVGHWLKRDGRSLWWGPPSLVPLLIPGKNLVPALHDGRARRPHRNRGADH